MADRPLNMLWLQSGGCGGCTLSIMCAESPDLLAGFEAVGIHVLWHSSMSEASGKAFVQILHDILKDNIQPRPLEQALIGAPVRSGEDTPVSVQHIVRSFDPCMVCTVH